MSSDLDERAAVTAVACCSSCSGGNFVIDKAKGTTFSEHITDEEGGVVIEVDPVDEVDMIDNEEECDDSDWIEWDKLFGIGSFVVVPKLEWWREDAGKDEEVNEANEEIEEQREAADDGEGRVFADDDDNDNDDDDDDEWWESKTNGDPDDVGSGENKNLFFSDVNVDVDADADVNEEEDSIEVFANMWSGLSSGRSFSECGWRE